LLGESAFFAFLLPIEIFSPTDVITLLSGINPTVEAAVSPVIFPAGGTLERRAVHIRLLMEPVRGKQPLEGV